MLPGMTITAQHHAIEQAVIATMAAVMEFEIVLAAASFAAVLATNESFVANCRAKFASVGHHLFAPWQLQLGMIFPSGVRS